MKLTETDRQLKNWASFLGCIQGLAWFLMSLICIGLYLDKPRLYDSSEHYFDYLEQTIYYLFLSRDHTASFDGQFINPTCFTVFMWLYMIFDFIWFILSIRLITNKIEERLTNLLKTWGLITGIICALDLFFTILLGVQYNKCIGNAIFIEVEAACANLILPILVIAAKGFVLWIINVIFARKLINMAKRQVGFVYNNTPTMVQVQHPAQHPQTPTSPVLPNLDNNAGQYPRMSENFHQPPPGQYPRFSHLDSPVQDVNRNRKQFGQYPAGNSEVLQNFNREQKYPPHRNPLNLNSEDFGQHLESSPSTNLNSSVSHDVNRFQFLMQIPRPDHFQQPRSLPSRY